MKKSLTTACFAVGLAVFAAVAISIHAQKKSGAQVSQQSSAQSPQKEQSGAQPAHAEGMSHADCPMMQGEKTDASAAGHDSHLAAVNERGERAMGFSQTETTHHFMLTRDGGFIQVEVNDAKDSENLNNIRQHLAHIARMFAEGDFDTPMLVHDRAPSGVAVMQRLKAEIKYAYEETEHGARVWLTTANAEALDAIHEFLRFQITDHKTGDPLEVSDR